MAGMGMPEKIEGSERFLSWFRNRVIPHWTAHGYDHQYGGFYESLDHTGKPISSVNRRVRVQARQIHTFARIARIGWFDEGRDLANAGFEYFLEKCCPDHGERGCIATISPAGDPIDTKRDLYDQAFLLLACAAMIELSDDPRAHALSENTFSFLQRELASPHGGWAEDDVGSLPRRQNPHMHMFEALLALHNATGRDEYRDGADAISKIFISQFFDPNEQALLEFFTDDLTTHDRDAGRIIEPGHMMEWVALLERYEQQTHRSQRALQETLYRRAKEIGLDRSSFLVNAINADTNATDGTRRLWPQTEYLRTAVILASKGMDGASSDATQLINALFSTYFDHETPGLWTDEYTADGNRKAMTVPASIVYHLFETATSIVATTTSKTP